MKTTPWYPGTVKPVRVGYYERVGYSSLTKDFWNGNSWRYGSDISMRCIYQNGKEWRGLTEESK